MDFVAELVDHHVAVVGEFLDGASALTDELLDAPLGQAASCIDADPTIRSILSRLVGQMAMWSAAVANEPYDFDVEHREPLDSMRRRLGAAGPTFAAYVRDVSENDRFLETFVDATCDPPHEFTTGGMIAHVLTYAAYRRTLLASALASVGVTGASDEPMGWFTS